MKPILGLGALIVLSVTALNVTPNIKTPPKTIATTSQEVSKAETIESASTETKAPIEAVKEAEPPSPPVVQTPPPPPPSPPAPKPAPVREGDCSLVNNYPWDKRIAYAVCMQESGGDKFAANTTDKHRDSKGNIICIGSYGLMQISCHSGKVFDPVQNMEIAWQKYQARGWQPWGAYTSGKYKKFL